MKTPQPMSDTDEQLAELLSKWHSWSAEQSPMARSYSSFNSTCRYSRTSRQYDDANGALDADIDRVLMEAVEAVIYDIADPWRTALSVQARNLATGAAVWNSPRLPADPRERVALTAHAMKLFGTELARRNLI